MANSNTARIEWQLMLCSVNPYYRFSAKTDDYQILYLLKTNNLLPTKTKQNITPISLVNHVYNGSSQKIQHNYNATIKSLEAFYAFSSSYNRQN